MEFNFEDMRRLSDLLKPEEESSDSDDDLPRVGLTKFGPGDINNKASKNCAGRGSKVKITGGNEKEKEKEEEAAFNGKSIWDEDEIPDGIVYDECEDPREKPQYEIKYKQNVTPEDMFLGMGQKTPGTASCEDMIVELKLPGEDKSNFDLQVLKQVLELRSRKYRLSLPLPHPVDPDSAKAAWDLSNSKLTVTLRMKRELDFVNF